MGISHTGHQQRFLKLKPLIHKEKTPITAVNVIDNMVCVATGSRIILYELDQNKHILIGRAIYDCHFMCVSVRVVKNLIIVGDIFKSLLILIWDQSTRGITLFARDDDRAETLSTSFCLDDNMLSFILTDGHKNIQLLRYLPTKISSIKYKKLLPRADYHVGSRVLSTALALTSAPTLINDALLTLLSTSISPSPSYAQFGHMLARQCYNPTALYHNNLINHRNIPSMYKIKTMHIGGTQDGFLTVLSPVEANIFIRLAALQAQMVYQLPHIGGLNPLVYRQFSRPVTQNRESLKRDIVDLDIVMLFLSLDVDTQKRITKAIGTTPAIVIDNIMRIKMASQLHPLV